MSDKRNSPIKGKSKDKKLGLENVSQNSEALEKLGNNFVVSFQYLDRNQGQTFEEWAKEGLLVNMLDTLRNYCMQPIYKQFNNGFKQYGEFPTKTNFKHPKHVPNGVNWASLHVAGKVCLGGHVYENIFYVVFLDKDHEFWITEKKHT